MLIRMENPETWEGGTIMICGSLFARRTLGFQ